MRFTTLRIGHAGAAHRIHKAPSKRDGSTPNASCNTGGFYTSPVNGATVSALDPLKITWDPTCLSTAAADIYLFAPGSSKARIHVWQYVSFPEGSYNATIMPRWWNSTSTQSLQLAIVPADTPPFLTTLPAGPVFTATYTPPSDGQPIPAAADTTQFDSGVTTVNNGALAKGSEHTMTPGKKAAAILLPLLFVLLLIGAYLKYQRSKGQQKRKRWSQAVDKRMSTISTDWKSMSAAGASAAIRSSMAVGRDSMAPGARESSAFAFGQIRPVSTLDGGQAGIGSAAGSQMTQVRTGTGVGLRGANLNGERVSRVSFAADTRVSRVSFADTVGRPSGESRRTRAFHSAYIPPLPTAQGRNDVISAASVYPDSVMPVEDGDSNSRYHSDDTHVAHPAPTTSSPKSEAVTLSPRQTQGPLTLTPEDIRARIHGGKVDRGSQEEERREGEMDEVLPALSMMRTGDTAGATSDEYLFTPMPAQPSPTHPKPTAGTGPASMYPAPFATSPSPTFPTAATYGGSPASPYGATSPYGSTLMSPLTPSTPSIFGQQQQLQMGAAPTLAGVMSPDDLVRDYAKRKAAEAAAAPAVARGGAGSPAPSAFGIAKLKGKKMSLRASFAGGRKEKVGSAAERMAISNPILASSSAPIGGSAYAIGEDDRNEDNESAYAGTAN